MDVTQRALRVAQRAKSARQNVIDSACRGVAALSVERRRQHARYASLIRGAKRCVTADDVFDATMPPRVILHRPMAPLPAAAAPRLLFLPMRPRRARKR
jgi:hypothetical protein